MQPAAISRGSRGASEQVDVSIVLPVYDEQDSLVELYESLEGVMRADHEWELIFVMDPSSDDSARVLRQLCERDERNTAIFLSRRYGHQIALTVGYDFARGRVVITMDSDLQHPPEKIPEMIELWEEGNDIVHAVRKSNEHVSWLKRTTSKYFYAVLRAVSDIDLVQSASEYRLLDRKVVRYLRQYRESGRFLRGIVSDMGFRRAVIDYDERQRKFGEPKYSYLQSLRLALRGVISFSSLPLRLSGYLGAACAVLSLLYAAWIVLEKVVFGIPHSGIAAILVGVFFIGGVQLISIGILGEYVANVFTEVKRRPLYCIDEIVGRRASDLADADG